MVWWWWLRCDWYRVKDDEAGGMAMFTAEHIPMMNSLCRAANKAIQQVTSSPSPSLSLSLLIRSALCMGCVWCPQNEHIITALAVMANACYKSIKNKK
jgi:hypothetical protein